MGGASPTAHCPLPTCMSELTQSVTRLIDEFAKLPGIGKKSAERLTYHVLRIHRNEALELAEAIRSVKDNVQYCRRCYNLAEGDECTICRDASRQQDVLCVVEQPRDLMALEQSGAYRGLYHVLLGRIAPLDGIGPEQLTIDALVRRVGEGGFKEVIMATNPTIEGDTTAMFIAGLLKPFGLKVTRIAHGMPVGGDLDYADQATLIQALEWRREM